MKAKTQFLKMYYKLPKEARALLVFNYWETQPMSLNVISEEVRNDTERGKKILADLGFKDEKTYSAKIIQGGMIVAGVQASTLEEAEREIQHYAMMYSSEGKLEIKRNYEVQD